MDLTKMYDIQKGLMAKIDKKHPADGEDRSAKKFVGMLTEFAECINEHRGFKFWSNDQEPREELLEEYVDGIHWILEHGIDYGFRVEQNYTLINEIENIEIQFIECIYWAVTFFKNPTDQNYSVLFAAYLGLGNMFGFSTDLIESAYMEKNEINHNRQDNSY
ncbi:dUTPase [Bacillus phage Silence]|nr:dUTPase [Bacillus phage Silence]